MSRARLAVLALLGLAVTAPSQPASAETGRGQLAYSCDVTTDQNPEGGKATYAFTSALQVDVPATVRPGDTLALSGTFSVQIPEDVRRPLAAYYSHIQVISDTLTIPVTVDGRTTTLRTSRFDSGRVSTAQQPLVLSGTVAAAELRVPDRARGSLRIDLPGNGPVQSHTENRQVAFNASVYYSGGLVAAFPDEISGKVSCAAPDGGNRLVASVPVSPEAGSEPTSDEPTPESQAPAAEPGGSVATTSGGASVQPPPTGTAGAAPLAAAVADPGSDPSTGGAPSAQGAAPPSTTALPVSGDDGIRVSDRTLVALCALLVLGAFALGGWSHHRVRMLRASLEG